MSYIACINLVSIFKEACKRGVSQFGGVKNNNNKIKFKKKNQTKPNKQTNK